MRARTVAPTGAWRRINSATGFTNPHRPRFGVHLLPKGEKEVQPLPSFLIASFSGRSASQ
jgi:hypothetical protein